MILGLQTIKKWKLVLEFPTLFGVGEKKEWESEPMEHKGERTRDEMGRTEEGEGIEEKRPEPRSAYEREDMEEINPEYLQAIPPELLVFEEGTQSEFDLPVEFSERFHRAPV